MQLIFSAREGSGLTWTKVSYALSGAESHPTGPVLADLNRQTYSRLWSSVWLTDCVVDGALMHPEGLISESHERC
jgi:hypothetical protein